MRVPRTLAIGAVLTSFATVLAWGAGTTDGGTSSGEPEVITVLSYDYEFPEYSLLKTRPAIEYAEQQTNVKIDWQLVGETEVQDKLALLIAAGGDLPDLFTNRPPNMTHRELFDRGITLAWSDYIDAGRMPKVAQLLEENPDFKNQITDAETGKIYHLPRLGNSSNLYWSDYVRGDWLSKLGIDDPETIEDYTNYLKAVVTRDPNGNGQADEVGWANFFGSPRWVTMLTRGFGLGGIDYFPWEEAWAVVNDREIVFKFTDERFRAMLEWGNELWTEGLVHPDQFNMDSAKFNALSNNNTLGGLNQWPENIVVIGEQLREVEPNAFYHGIPHPIDPRFMGPSDRKYAYNPPGLWQTYISAETEKLDAVLRFVDFTLGDPDFAVIAEFGIEGVHHQVLPNGTREYIGELADLDQRSRGFFLGTSVGYLPAQFQAIAVNQKVATEPAYADVRAWAAQVKPLLRPTIYWQLTAADNEIVLAATKDIQDFIDESVTKFIVGTKPLSEWDSYVATINEQAGPRIQAAIDVRQAYFDQNIRATY